MRRAFPLVERVTSDGTNYSKYLAGIQSQPDAARAVAQAQESLPSNDIVLSSLEAMFSGASRQGADNAKSSGASRNGAAKPTTKPAPFLAFPSDQRFKLSDLDWAVTGVTTMRKVELMAFFRQLAWRSRLIV